MFAPLLFVSPKQINYQVPWEILGNNETVQAQIIVNGVASQPFDVDLTEFSPGIFSFDFGPGRAIVTNLDNTVAQPIGGVDDFGLAARPARVGEFIVILATGVGAVDLPPATGFNSFDLNGNFVQRDVVGDVQVFIGGVEATVAFAALSPQFVGVYQLNVILGEGTPTGDAVPIVIEIGGVQSRDDVTIAVGPVQP